MLNVTGREVPPSSINKLNIMYFLPYACIAHSQHFYFVITTVVHSWQSPLSSCQVSQSQEAWEKRWDVPGVTSAIHDETLHVIKTVKQPFSLPALNETHGNWVCSIHANQKTSHASPWSWELYSIIHNLPRGWSLRRIFQKSTKHSQPIPSSQS